MENIITSWVVNFILRTLAQEGGNDANWQNIKETIDAEITAHIPAVADAALEVFANSVIADLELLLTDSADLQVVADDAIAQNWSGALAALAATAERIFTTPTQTQLRVLHVLKAA